VSPFSVVMGSDMLFPNDFGEDFLLIVHLAVSVEHRLVTDRQTHDDGINCANTASCCKN